MESRDPSIDALQRLTANLGAGARALLPAGEVRVDDKLVDFCRDGCSNYGMSPGCPPHVAGPAWFRTFRDACRFALVIRLDVAASELFGGMADPHKKQLHTIVSTLERAAQQSGFPRSAAFAGGSCRALFCSGENGCPVLDRDGACCHADIARPSMSGYGIDVSSLMQSCGWPSEFGRPAQGEGMSWLAGLVMLAEEV